MNFTEVPENVICVFSLAFNSENLAQVFLFRDAFNHLIEKLRLGHWVFVVHGEMVEELIFSRICCPAVVLKETEASNKITLSLVGLWCLSHTSIRELLEEPLGKLGGAVVGSTEDGGQDGSSHPGFPQNGVASLPFPMDRHPFVDGQRSAAGSKRALNVLNTHHLPYLLGVVSVVTVRYLNAFNDIFASAVAHI